MVPLKFVCGLFAVVSEAAVVFMLQQTAHIYAASSRATGQMDSCKRKTSGKAIFLCGACQFYHNCLFIIDYLRLIYAFAVEIILMTFKTSDPNWSSGESVIFKVQNRRQIAGSLEKINIKHCRVELGIGPVKVILFIGYTYLGSMITNDARCTRFKLNPGLPWKKHHSARIRLFSPANWT